MSAFDHKSFLKGVPHRPGVYCMFNQHEEILYVGKAKNLLKRLQSYFRKTNQPPKTVSLVKQIANIEITIADSETEALLLESNLIKQHRPRYNVLFRDDKSYPFIYLSKQHAFPRLCYYRGKQKPKGRYFGPYPNAVAVHETLNTLQRVFKLRQCDDTFFKNRSRPCLQYQIKRCTAPCVDYIDEATYAADVEQVVLFLEGKDDKVIEVLRVNMEQAAEVKDYELAAENRDKISKLRQIQGQQSIHTDAKDTDIIVLTQSQSTTCVGVMFVRGGKVIGQKSYFPKVPSGTESADVLQSFIAQYYLASKGLHVIPKQLLFNVALPDHDNLQQALSETAEHRVQLTLKPRGERLKWVNMALNNAKLSLSNHLSHNLTLAKRYQALQELVSLECPITRMECFDISHTRGEATYASCVVFDENGPRTSDYRRYAINNITPGDDYAALHQAIERRYTKIKLGEGTLPTILIIDGGKGQLTQAEQVLEELQITDVIMLAISKGPKRKAGEEKVMMSGREQALALTADSLALHLIQHIRDEAHRFAITGHRKKRAKTRKVSSLEGIPGIGAAKRKELLRQFGGLQTLSKASIDEIAKTPGISRTLAERIYNELHEA